MIAILGLCFLLIDWLSFGRWGGGGVRLKLDVQGTFFMDVICVPFLNLSSVSGLTPKQESWRKKSILTKHPSLSYHTDGLRAFVDVTEYPSEEKLTQLKSQQQLCVLLLRNSMQSLHESA